MIVAGFGFRAGAPLESLRAALRLAQRGHPSVTHLATVTDKLSGLSPLGQALDLPVLAISPEALSSVATPPRSVASLAAYASGSVAEASALCAAGRGARLLGPRHVSPDRMATCAIAEGPQS
ncbi:MAG: cobalamin biosynthesis protein [Sphingomonas sp.]|uniref:cobalamin biosynthesis protein n=1 Tax=Sphingomonas sp. TaxID=28214 RepID=UPI00258EAA1C|nr:cobalamin biosynthesis protein [Sphingomonas sp.]MCP4027560.1 cobalamin biosynthesis protein [Sphingomonas sp.]